MHEEPEMKHMMFEISALKRILFMGFINFLMMSFTIFTLRYCCMSTVFIIFRLSQSLSLIITKKNNLKSEDYIASILNIFGFLMVIYSPSYYYFENESNKESGKGIFFAIIVCILLTYLQVSSDKEKLKFVDLQIFVSGIMASSFGCASSIALDQSLYINIWVWILVIMDTAFVYFSIYFKIKTIKSLVHNIKLIPWSFVSIVVVLIFGFIIFRQRISIIYAIGLIIIIVNVVLHSRSASRNKNNINENDEF